MRDTIAKKFETTHQPKLILIKTYYPQPVRFRFSNPFRGGLRCMPYRLVMSV